MRRGTNLPRVGGYNRAVIMEAIRCGDGVSRADVASRTGLTPQTVSTVVRALLADGLVVETGSLPSNGGRSGTALSLNAGSRYAVGVHLDPGSTVAVLVDLAGRIVAQERDRLPVPQPPDTFAERLAGTVDRLVTAAGVARDRLLGVGLAVPGPIDPERQLVVFPPNLAGWSEVPLPTVLGEKTGLPVVMDNDATAAAIGERWVGGPHRVGSLLFVYLGTGIGAGIALGDGIQHGDSGNAGEIGHLVVVPDGNPCRCGARGCLEAHCAPPAVVAGHVRRHGPEEAARLGLSLAPADTFTDYGRICEAAAGGDPASRATVAELAELCAQAVRGAVNLLDVSTVVLGGPALPAVERALRTAITRQVNELTLAHAVRRVAVEPSLIGTDAGAIGAASLVLHGRFSPGWSMLVGHPS
jgi:predicted NBD/HSP70 family sugar kinase